MKVIPLDDRVLVKPLESTEEKTPGGLYIPDSARDKSKMGEVVEVGTDEDLKEVIKKGDKVLWAKYGGEEFKINGENHIILQRSDILAIIR